MNWERLPSDEEQCSLVRQLIKACAFYVPPPSKQNFDEIKLRETWDILCNMEKIMLDKGVAIVRI